MTHTVLPALAPSLRILDRAPGEVQLGAHHASARVLTGLSPADRLVLHRLDGAHRPQQLGRIYDECGEDARRLDDLLDVLTESGLLQGPQDRRPTGGRVAALPVLLAGTGPLVDEVSAVLRRQHRRVHTQADLAPADLPVPPTVWSSATGRPPALAVLVADGAVDPLVARQWGPWAMVLPVVVTDEVVTVGPAWADVHDPCPMCLDHYRADRDPAWPRVLAQLTARGADGRLRSAGADPSTTALTCGVVAALAADLAEGRTVAPGLATEIHGGTSLPVQRVWGIHPRCVTHLPAVDALAG